MAATCEPIAETCEPIAETREHGIDIAGLTPDACPPPSTCEPGADVAGLTPDGAPPTADACEPIAEACAPSKEKPCIPIDRLVSLNIRMQQCDLPYRLHRIENGDVALWANVRSSRVGFEDQAPQENDGDVPAGFLDSIVIEDLCSVVSAHRCVTEVYVNDVDLDPQVADLIFSNMPWLKTFKLRGPTSIPILPAARWDKLETAVLEVRSPLVVRDILPTLLRATEYLELHVSCIPAHDAQEQPKFSLRDAHAKAISLRTTMCVRDILDGNTKALRVTVHLPWLPLNSMRVWSHTTCVGAIEVILRIEKFHSYNRVMHFLRSVHALRGDVEFSVQLCGSPSNCGPVTERNFRGIRTMYEEFSEEMDGESDRLLVNKILRVFSPYPWNSMSFVDELCAGYTQINVRLVHLSLHVSTVDELLYFDVKMDRTPLMAREMQGNMSEEVGLLYLLCSESLVSISVDCSRTTAPDDTGRWFCDVTAKYEVTQELMVTFSGNCVIHRREKAAATVDPVHLGRNVRDLTFKGTGSDHCDVGESIVFDLLMNFLLFPMSKVRSVHVECVNDDRMQRQLFTVLSKNFSVISLIGKGIRVTNVYAAEELARMICNNKLINEVRGIELPTMTSQLALAGVLGGEFNCTLFRFSPDRWTCEELYHKLIKNRDVCTAVEAMIDTGRLHAAPFAEQGICIYDVKSVDAEHVAKTVVAFKNVLFKDNIAALPRKRKMTVGVFDGESPTKAHMNRAAELYRQVVEDIAKYKRMRLDYDAASHLKTRSRTIPL